MMTKTKAKLTAILVLLLAFVMLLAMAAPNPAFEEETESISLTSDESGTLSLINENGKTDYTIIFSSDSNPLDYSLSQSVQGLFVEKGIVTVNIKSDALQSQPLAHEILIGQTNRDESKNFLARVEAACENADDLAWGYAVVGEKVLFLANSDVAFNYAQGMFLDYITKNNLVFASDLCVIETLSAEEYQKMLDAEKEAQKEKIVEELIAKISAFKQSDFGGMPLEMPTDYFDDPYYYPADNQHPRLFFTEDKVEDMYYNLMNDPNMETLNKRFWQYANAENFTGIFPTQHKNGVPYNFDVNILAQLEAKALAYALTGDVVYGYEAILGAKNVILTLKYIPELHADTYHGASQVMVNVAKVYDWCYDLLTEDDKNHIIAGVCNVLAPQLEGGMKFPPSGMSAVSGHGTGPQFIRDWVTVSIAFYDEVPSWWDFVGGRYFEQYVPVIDYCYQGGYASQGTVTYGDSKYFTKGWAAWLVKTATGEFPYVDNFHLGAYYYFSHFQPNGYYFQTGDGGRSTKGCAIDPCFMFISAALFQDPVIANMAKIYSKDYTSFSYAFTTETTVCDVLIFYTYGPDFSDCTEEDLAVDLIQYLDFPSGTMTARNSWDEDGAAVLMRIANMTMANHDLNDHGTFQIYYKGLLAGTSGAYNKYGSYVHRYYLQATVAHNGLLIFDPALSDSEPTYGTNAKGEVDTTVIKNVARYYYSGSQRARGEAGTIENWLSGDYNMADVYGAAWGYDLETGAAKYAYIAGDMTQAYPLSTAAYMGRKMLTVFTDDPNYPMLFFTYDQMASVQGGENFRKSFLLHTIKEPEIDTENLTATITHLDGRLFMHSISGAQKIAKVGGYGYAYWINNAVYENEDGTLAGKNCWNDGYTTTDNGNNIWGRIELTATGNIYDSFLTAMYVTDATNEQMLDLTKIESESVDGVKIMNSFAIFTKTDANAQQYKEFTFNTDGKGLYEYYVAGVEAGTWCVKVDGVPVAWAYASEGESLLVFTAPAGEVTVTPGNDVIGANGGKIKYNSLGGILPDDTPYTYNNEQVTPLPTNVVRGADTFLGWYTSPSYEPETKITEIPVGTSGTVTVYARYLSTLIDADFTSDSFFLSAIESNKANIVNFSASGKTGASFKTKLDEDGVQYVEWIEGSKDPLINYSSKSSNLATMSSEDECATFTVTIAKNGDEPMIASQFRIYTKKTVTGGQATTRQYIFTTNTKGEVRLGSSAAGPLVTVLDSQPTTLRFVMDFKNEEIRAYDDFGILLASLKVSVNADSGAKNMSEWRKLLDEVVFYWYGGTSADINASMRIYGIKIEEGNRVNAAEATDGSIVYSTDGGRLPNDAPKTYSKDQPTVLPIPTLENAVFTGWYTTPTFDPETRITEIPAGTEGVFNVYAKWNKIIVFEDYSSTEINHSESNKQGPNSISYNGASCPGSSFITKTDEQGVAYLEYSRGENDPRIIKTTGEIAAASNTSISYELVIGKDGDKPFGGFLFRTLAKQDVNGNALSSNNQLYMFMIDENGACLSNGGDKTFLSETKFAEFEDDKITVRVVLDFKNCLIIGVGADGNTVSVPFDIPASSGATNGIEYMKTFSSYVFYLYPHGKANSSARIYSIKVTDGDIYTNGNIGNGGTGDDGTGDDDEVIENKIAYEANGGVLPKNAPKVYDKNEPTVLPTPSKTNYVFLGWYTSSTFEDETLVTEVPTNTEGNYAVYAKWLKVLINENYEQSEFSIVASSSVVAGIKYNAIKGGASFETKTDENGNTYLEWYKGENDPILSVGDGAIAKMSSSLISYEIVMAKNGSEIIMAGSARTMAQYDKDGNKLSDSAKIQIFGNTSGGEVYLASNREKMLGTIPADGSTFTVRVVIDFENLQILGYLDDGTVISTTFKIPEATGVSTGAEFRALFTTYVFYWQGSSAAPEEGTKPSLRVESIKICEGNIFAS